MESKLINGDSLEVLKDYDENSIDLLCTDPPYGCLLYTSPSPRDVEESRMPSSA